MTGKLAKLLRPLFASGGDHSVEGRGRERMRRVYMTVAASLASRFGSIAVLLVTVPMALDHLGTERFGMWMVLSSFAAILAFADFGIGNGILNLVASASGADDDAAVRRVASSGFVLLSAIGLAIAAIALAAYPFVRWEELFQVSSPLAVAEAGPSVLVFLLCFALILPAGVGSKVQTGLQRGYEANLWMGAGSLLSFVAVAAAILAGAGTPWLVLGLFGSPPLALIVGSVVFFQFQRPDLAPRLRWASAGQSRILLRLGFSFFLLQLVWVLAFRIDALLAAQFFGPEVAGAYAVVDRLFSLLSLLITLCLAPLWPAYREAISRGDHDWLIRTLKTSLLLAIGFPLLGGIVLTLFSRFLIDLWVGPQVAAPLALVAGFAVWKVLEGGGNALAMFMNAAGMMRFQVIVAILTCVSATALKLIFAPSLGVWALVWITAASYALFVVMPVCFVVPRALKGMVASGVPSRG